MNLNESIPAVPCSVTFAELRRCLVAGDKVSPVVMLAAFDSLVEEVEQRESSMEELADDHKEALDDLKAYAREEEQKLFKQIDALKLAIKNAAGGKKGR